jgi:integrase
MSLRNRGGTWHYRFYAAGREWSENTGLAATERNRSAALMAEAEARRLVKEGRAELFKLQAKAFRDAADQFIEWAKGEHQAKPNTWKRLRGSMTSLKEYFGKRPLHTITVGQVQDYMSWRRVCPHCNGEGCGTCEETGRGIKEVTLRHDLHALSPLFSYGLTHNWCSQNPVERVKVPGDADAVRIHVLSPAEERLYFEGCLRTAEELSRAASQLKGRLAWAKQRAAQAFRNLHDLGLLMILQGPRPSEAMRARVEHVSLTHSEWEIPGGKSKAARRTLHLTPQTQAILEARIDLAGPDGWLFRGKERETPLSDVENAHGKILEKFGLAFVIYDFRHTFATRFAEATGGDVVALAAILGHSNLRTVMRYVHVSREHQKVQMRQFVLAEERRRAQSWSGFGPDPATESHKSGQTTANEDSCNLLN